MVTERAEEFGREAARLFGCPPRSWATDGWRDLYLRVGAEMAAQELAGKLAFDQACREWWAATRAVREAGLAYWGPRWWPKVASDLRRESLVADEAV
jgi:hypothetical protein